MTVNDEQLAAATAAIGRAVASDAMVAIYLYGSAMAGGLRPDSDLDLAVITARRMTAREKHELFDAVRPLSRRSLRAAGGRPLEVTVVALPDVRPWRYPPVVDAQYGEWLTDLQLNGQIERGPVASPDLAVLVTMLHQASRACHGRPAGDVLDPVPHDDLVRATLDALPDLLADLENDTRNVLLTLARMWSTIATGTIWTKDGAAEWAAERLPPGDRVLLEEARTQYQQGGWGEWNRKMAAVRRLADRMRNEIRAGATPS